ncbi:MotA/TolQ/ExbB proton channel family protein [Ferrimonas sp. SCSIO 43195]|uniref:MotA/TolQ/ExbB proton channel family protein n=1 Tax=Ferrimonas sp. SCSIO 43195 TaxID=2822844 RepID=UPI00207645A6|nr:MotA/TolQ/ExbB proton channel family protein [Ferrimonas sp. SCSIO 43195]USD38834.1 MotA/TolQ/ExbB proton channel family protein [Ferrimonas sp. SCSIO 43195]
MIAWWEWLSRFMAQGGPVLWGLAGCVLLTWFLIAERIGYLLLGFPRQQRQALRAWQQRKEHLSWYAKAQRQGLLARAERGLHRYLSLIKALVAICPMLGLMGTVTGMISVFEVMAANGTGDPKMMSAGIAMATLPTMAGMVAALAGLFVHARLTKGCQRTLQRLAINMQEVE